MIDLLLCDDVVITILNLEISRCHLADSVTELYLSVCSTYSTIIFPHSTNHIIVLLATSLPLQWSLLKFFNTHIVGEVLIDYSKGQFVDLFVFMLLKEFNFIQP